VDIKSGIKVAVKLLRRQYADSPEIVWRFHREAAFANTLRHVNICGIIDHGTREDGTPYLVMPLLEGQSFEALLSQNRSLPTWRIIEIVCQTLDALGAAHEKRIVHRDLKPDNIFIVSTEDGDQVKLLDFGISKLMENQSASTFTATGMVLGTAHYLAPEQARGSLRFDHRVDIYAMGVILYKALVGRLPFTGANYHEVVYKIGSTPFEHPRTVNPDISCSMERVIVKAMANDPLNRYETASKMRDALLMALETPTLVCIDMAGDALRLDTEQIAVTVDKGPRAALSG
jgi:eukaryotic-like serine/threonine-protein kinase